MTAPPSLKNGYAGPPLRSCRALWRSLPGWKAFRYDSELFAPMSEDELAEEGWP
jgi:hypothetical protein